MKGVKKCFGVLLAFSITFLSSLSVFSADTRAFNITDSDYYSWSSGRIVGALDWYSLTSAPNGALSRSTSGGAGGVLESFKLCLTGSIPANTLFTFNLQSKLDGTWRSIPLSTRSTDFSVLSHTFGEYGVNSYLFYNSATISGCLEFYTPREFSVSGLVDIYVSGINGIQIQSSGLTPSQAQTLMNRLNYINTGVDDISADVQSIVDAINEQNEREEEQQQQEQEDRDNLESQSSQASGDADSSQADVENLGGNFADYIGGIATALGASPTDCKFRANFGIGNFDAGEVDLCQLSLPTEFQIIGSILLIAFVVPLAWATLNKIIALIRSFQ